MRGGTGTNLTSETGGAAANGVHDLALMAGEVAHELNNVLTAVGGNLALLLECGSAAEGAAVTFLNAARASVERGARLSERLEAFAGRLRLDPGSVDLGHIVATTLRRLPARVLRDVELRYSASPRAPAALADGEKLASAIMGLSVSAATALAGADGILEIRVGSAGVSESSDVPLPAGTYAHVGLKCTGSGASVRELSLAYRTPYAGGPASRHHEWDIASVAGFARQSRGHLALGVEAEDVARLDLYLPVDAGAGAGV